MRKQHKVEKLGMKVRRKNKQRLTTYHASYLGGVHCDCAFLSSGACLNKRSGKRSNTVPLMTKMFISMWLILWLFKYMSCSKRWKKKHQEKADNRLAAVVQQEKLPACYDLSHPPHFWRRSCNKFIALLRYVSDVMLTNCGKLRNVKSGGSSQDDDHCSHEVFRRRLIEFLGAFGFRLWAK